MDIINLIYAFYYFLCMPRAFSLRAWVKFHRQRKRGRPTDFNTTWNYEINYEINIDQQIESSRFRPNFNLRAKVKKKKNFMRRSIDLVSKLTKSSTLLFSSFFSFVYSNIDFLLFLIIPTSIISIISCMSCSDDWLSFMISILNIH